MTDASTDTETYSNVDWRLDRVRDGYAEGRMSMEEMEAAIEHVLAGGFVDKNGVPTE